MSFRLFVYYCAICGAWAAFLGWSLARLLSPQAAYGKALTHGAVLGLSLAFALCLVDVLWSGAFAQLGWVAIRVAIAALVGSFGGLIGAAIGQFLITWTNLSFLIILGWVLTGLLIGRALGVYDLIARLVRHESLAGAMRKLLNGILGGTLGGLLGGSLYMLLDAYLPSLLGEDRVLLSPSATGFVALGLLIGLLIGL